MPLTLENVCKKFVAFLRKILAFNTKNVLHVLWAFHADILLDRTLKLN